MLQLNCNDDDLLFSEVFTSLNITKYNSSSNDTIKNISDVQNAKINNTLTVFVYLLNSDTESVIIIHYIKKKPKWCFRRFYTLRYISCVNRDNQILFVYYSESTKYNFYLLLNINVSHKKKKIKTELMMYKRYRNV